MIAVREVHAPLRRHESIRNFSFFLEVEECQPESLFRRKMHTDFERGGIREPVTRPGEDL